MKTILYGLILSFLAPIGIYGQGKESTVDNADLGLLGLLFGLHSTAISDSIIEREWELMEETDSLNEFKVSPREVILRKIKDNDGRIIKHIAERGESWESIANKYGISKEELIQMNYLHKSCYVGIELEVPVYFSDYELFILKVNNSDSRYQQARQKLAEGDYSDAVKIYDEIIDSSNSSVEAYYNRGLALYNRGKYSKAIDDFNYVRESDVAHYYPDADELHSKAYAAWEQRQNEKAEIWAGILQMGVQVANAYVQASQQEQMAKGAGSTNSNTASNTIDYSDNDNEESTVMPSSGAKKRCGLCSGKGYIVEYTAGFGLAQEEYCEECGKNMMSNHYHKTCMSCDGTGYR